MRGGGEGVQRRRESFGSPHRRLSAMQVGSLDDEVAEGDAGGGAAEGGGAASGGVGAAAEGR